MLAIRSNADRSRCRYGKAEDAAGLRSVVCTTACATLATDGGVPC